jgi:alpha-1,3-rhamnosyl/mannosyltransferase
VLTIHDLSLLLHSETHETARVRRARRRLPLMARAATMIVTPTESVRGEVCEHLKVAGNRVVAVPEAARAVFRPQSAAETLAVRKRLTVADDFLLFVGTLEPRKNLPVLVRAFREVLRETGGRLQLVIAGQKGWLTDALFSEVKESGLNESVRFTGYVSDDELRALYSSCKAFVYPSLYEGFGLPPLEAMACGAPVVASSIPSIKEIVGDAALLVAPADTPGLTRAIIKVLRDDFLRQRTIEKGIERAASFSWQRTARLMRGVYDEALARGRSVEAGK